MCRTSALLIVLAQHPDLIEYWRGLLTRLLRARIALTKSQALEELACAAPARCCSYWRCAARSPVLKKSR